ncbi:MAG: 3-deoxy-7-phosphoheptulonate synthase, partial [Aeromonadaceae bacterium]|nr:3-deoxy-7-phosphoheptulonate synthase [Aeromonadaceae bacterium]
SAIVQTGGNPDCHIILRGGKLPNYSAEHVAAVATDLAKAGLPQKVMVDFSHANSSKQYQKQMEVCTDVCNQVAHGSQVVFGVMVESHLVAGRQDLVEGQAAELTYGQSITDACIGWGDTEQLLRQLADAVVARRR